MTENIRIGAHMKISKGFSKVPEETIEIGGNTFQIFVHSPRVWKIKEPDPKDVKKFRENMKKANIPMDKVLVHSGYLINLAAPKDDIWKKSIDLMIKEIKATVILGIKYFNVHPGSALKEGEDFGIDRIAKALDIILSNFENTDIMILLENVSPKGGNIGYKMEQMKRIIEKTAYPKRIGLTYDTCHGFDAGYDITEKDGVKNLLDEIDKYVGLDKFKMIHLNDSKYKLGEAKDRHEFIGMGNIGEKGFEVFFSFEEILKRPLILETPGDKEEYKRDIQTVKRILKNLGINL